MDIHGIILAAGGSTRMDEKFPKLTLPFRRKPLLWWSLRAALDSNLKSVTLIVGANKNKVLYAVKNIGGGERFKIHVNSKWKEGRSTSVAKGIKSLKDKSEHIMFIQGDQPLMTSKLINSVLSLAEEYPSSPMVYPVYKGEKANPVLYSSKGLKELLKIGGDVSGYILTELLKDDVETFEIEDDSTQFNVNTNGDYRKLIEEYEKE